MNWPCDVYLWLFTLKLIHLSHTSSNLLLIVLSSILLSFYLAFEILMLQREVKNQEVKNEPELFLHFMKEKYKSVWYDHVDGWDHFHVCEPLWPKFKCEFPRNCRLCISLTVSSIFRVLEVLEISCIVSLEPNAVVCTVFIVPNPTPAAVWSEGMRCVLLLQKGFLQKEWNKVPQEIQAFFFVTNHRSVVLVWFFWPTMMLEF